MKEMQTFWKELLNDKERDQMLCYVSVNNFIMLTAEPIERPLSRKTESFWNFVLLDVTWLSC